MRIICIFFMVLSAMVVHGQQQQSLANPMIDYGAFLRGATNVGNLREQRRVPEEQFVRMASEAGTVVLDARSKEKYEMLHVRGARHLSLPDMTAGELAKIIPTKGSRVLIYCNNNFRNEETAFPSKVAAASLNIYTFNALHGYGYTNVYELGPLIDITRTKLPLEGSRLAQSRP